MSGPSSRGENFQEAVGGNMLWSYRTKKDYLLLYLLRLCSFYFMENKIFLWWQPVMYTLCYMLSAGGSLFSFLSLMKKLRNVREANYLNVIYMILHTAYSPFLDIFHIVWVIELMLGSLVLILGYFYMPFFRDIKWKSLQILSCGFLQLCQQCRLKICVNNALAHFKKKI